jgi:hypothetical protein
VLLSLQQERVPEPEEKILLRSRAYPLLEADNLTANYEQVVYTLYYLQHLTNLQAFVSSY